MPVQIREAVAMELTYHFLIIDVSGKNDFVSGERAKLRMKRTVVVGPACNQQLSVRSRLEERFRYQVRVILRNEPARYQIVLIRLDPELPHQIRIHRRLDIRAVGDHRRIPRELLAIKILHGVCIGYQLGAESHSGARCRSEIGSRDRTPFGTCPVKSIDVHYHFPAEHSRKRSMMPHPDIYEKEDLIPASGEAMNQRAKRGDD